MYELTNFMVIKRFLWSMHNKSQFSHDYLYDINTRSYLALPPKAKQSWLLDSRFRPDAFCENHKIFIIWEFASHGFSNMWPNFGKAPLWVHLEFYEFTTILPTSQNTF